MHTLKSIESQVHFFLSQEDALLKLDLICRTVSPDIYPKTWSHNDVSSFSFFWLGSSYARLRAIEMWILFPEISPFTGWNAEILSDLWIEATRDTYGCMTPFPGKEKIEAMYGPYITNIRKIFFPPKATTMPIDEVERLKHLLELKNQQIASLKMVIDVKDRLLELQNSESQDPTSS